MVKKISYSFGIIDLLHYGHINTLLRSKNGSDLHIFGLVSDEAAIDWMGTIVSNYDERKSVLQNVSCIDKIVFQKTLDPLENLKKIHEEYPDAVITLYHGDNWKVMPSEQYLNSIGGKIVFTEYYEKMKPENILKQLNERATKKRSVNNLISTKANTLAALKSKLKQSSIEDLEIIKVSEFTDDYDLVLKKIYKRFKGKKIVVRSSSSNEDSLESSNAGHYESVLNVNGSSVEEVKKAIEVVVDSYYKDGLTLNTEQILVQSQTEDVHVSGVVFTRDIHQNRPYYLINYDDNGSTDSVTSGVGGKTIWIAHDSEKIDSPWDELVRAVREIECLMDDMVLDIEFAVTHQGKVVIFQVRPLAANYKYKYENNDRDMFRLKNNEKNKYISIVNEIENGKMMLSDMAFWNPSEIIGSNPRNLEYSLYREIITKRAWNEGLVPMGYKAVNRDLMYKIGNKPYISLEYSFMSLIPESLSKELSIKLMRFYKEKLKKDVTAHDKIEFEIVVSCFDFETDEKLKELLDYGFSVVEIQEIKEALFNMTQGFLKDYFTVLRRDLEDLNILTVNREKVLEKLSFKEDDLYRLIDYFKLLIKDLKKYGTPHFSRQARYAFIARSLCKSLVSKNYFSEETMETFMLSIETVASEFENDFNLYLSKQLSRDEFNKKYGHLRSGTYDIRTDRYDQIYFEASRNSVTKLYKKESKVNPVSILDSKVIDSALNSVDLKLEPEEFIAVLKQSFEQREYFKFEFTKSLSLAIEILRKIGELLEIDRKSLSYLEISDILASEYYTTTSELREFWLTIINQRKAIYKEKSKLVLPEVILSEDNIDIIKIGESRPNFITQKNVSGDIALIEVDNTIDIEDKIVVITKADPGFDWIFAKGIKGLITKYGGVASHMAIRCAEFGIPAAIGCGEKIFDYVSGLNTIDLDCKKGKIIEGR
ncbi:PEP/pyruvate-binding domain-containing protein [Sedimentibacter sp.]|uniref:PEP/pyruvate-binding domain-containing protein n=1 Tax=Sedimentibacter sp. TaxID=1960295 RepID=UPI0028ACE70C|nr:PEP/pyruvate-binding domain-containing protein [Sedimentibacter sp.]